MIPPNRYLLRPSFIALLGLICGQVLAMTTNLASVWPGVLLSVVSMIVCLLASQREAVLAAAFACLFVGTGAVRQASLQAGEESAFRTMESLADGGAPLSSVSGRLSAFPQRVGTGWLLTVGDPVVGLKGRSIRPGAPIALRLSANRASESDPRDLVPGDEVSATGSIHELPRVPGNGDPFQWLRSKGAIAYLCVARMDNNELPADDDIAQRFLRKSVHVGNAIESRIREVLPESSASIAVAMTLGRTHLLSPERRRDFQKTGLMHIFAVSGLHTMIVGGMFLFILRSMGCGAVMRLVLLSIFLAFFASLVGLRASVLRAAALLMVYEGKELLGRPVDSLAVLSTVALVMLLWSPRALFQVDFRMSFLCALAIVLASPWMVEIQRVVGGGIGWGVVSGIVTKSLQVLAISAFIQLMLAPVLVSMVGEVSVISPLANLLLLGPLALILQSLLVLLLLSLGIPGMENLAGLLHYPLDWASALAGWLAELPFATVSSPSWPIAVSVLLYICIATSLFFRRRAQTQPMRRPVQFAPAVLGILALFVWMPWLNRPRRELTVWFLDIGQGDAILLRTPDGLTGLIDGGPPSSEWFLPSMIRARGVSQLDFVLATHADTDHVGGLGEVLTELPVGRVYTGGTASTSRDYRQMEVVRQTNDIPETQLRRGDSIRLGATTTLTVLHPTEEFVSEGIERNAASLVTRIDHAGRSILLTGDAETTAEISMWEANVLSPVDVLKAGHHGAGESTGDLLLDAVTPSAVIVDCGVNNRYGHPAPEMLERLASRGIPLWRTDRDGTIQLTIDHEGTIQVRTTRRARELIW